ncbi:hypothetical protein DPMN_053931 [Dreissena polymorpha]|uniref:Uncharacterized protein n=1 Tax=Dreissena polymorpha TaxID=45954 RepID=A0A9D4CPM1_DREPO|nr:hypothetical protein DPMN_053931 [Dreissena polymorpha]
MNNLTKFHEDWMKTVTSIVYTRINILTKLHKDWMKTIVILTKFHKDWMKTIVILTKFHKDWIKTINILTKFHKGWMKTVTSTVYTNILLTDTHTHDGRQTSHGHISSPRHLQLVTKFGEDRMKFWDRPINRPTDRQTDRQSDSYIAPITSNWGIKIVQWP